MSFQTVSDAIDKFIKIKPWLQFVGYLVALGGLILLAAKCGLSAGLVIAYLGVGVSMAGFDYKQIYP